MTDLFARLILGTSALELPLYLVDSLHSLEEQEKICSSCSPPPHSPIPMLWRAPYRRPRIKGTISPSLHSTADCSTEVLRTWRLDTTKNAWICTCIILALRFHGFQNKSRLTESLAARTWQISHAL